MMETSGKKETIREDGTSKTGRVVDKEETEITEEDKTEQRAERLRGKSKGNGDPEKR